jgi:transcriptional regulator with XRE-family HTH domain
MDEVGREVRKLREERGWNQAKLAVEAGMAPSAVNQIENGKRSPSAASLTKLAEALGVGVADLFPKGQAPLPVFDKQAQLDELAGRSFTFAFEEASNALDGFCAHWERRLREGDFDQKALDDFGAAVEGFVPVLKAAFDAERAELPPGRPGEDTFAGSVLWPAIERLIFVGTKAASAYPKAEIIELRDYFPRAG